MVVLELCDEHGHGGERDSVGDDLRTGRHRKNGWFLLRGYPMETSSARSSCTAPTSRSSSTAPTSRHQETETSSAGLSSSRGGDRDGDFVRFVFLNGAEPARPGNEDLVGGFLLLHCGGTSSAARKPRNGDLVGGFLFFNGARARKRDVVALLHQKHGAAFFDCQHGDPGVHQLSQELVRLILNAGDGVEDMDCGEELATRARLLLDVGDGHDTGGEDLARRIQGEEIRRHVRLPIAACQHAGDGLPGGTIWSYYLYSDDDSSSEFSWKHVLGYPMVQTIPNTCALVAATVCLEAQHRLEFEKKFGAGSLPCRAAAPRKLRSACFRERVWDPQNGADTERVLEMIMRIGGARTTNAPPPAPFFLPLVDWQRYGYDSFLTPDTVVKQLFEHGPCIGSFFVTPQYFSKTFGSNPPNAAFRGCRREDRDKLKKEQEQNLAGMHAVVCYAYRRRKKGEGFDILVLDNQKPIGVSRWIEFEEFDSFLMLYVSRLPTRHLLGRALPPQYPFSI